MNKKKDIPVSHFQWTVVSEHFVVHSRYHEQVRRALRNRPESQQCLQMKKNILNL